MDNTVKKIIALAAVAVILGVAVYGSYLPLRKAQSFIVTLRSLQTQPATSLQDLETRISMPLDSMSPIGQEELVRNMANSILAFVQRGTDATSTTELLDYLHTYYDPIIARGVGMSFGQDLYLLGAIHEIAFARFGNPAYLEAAKQYYVKANELGPNRPQPLYGLFDVYRAEGNASSATVIANKILENWPGDQTIRIALVQFLAASAKIAPPKNK
jgi:hypothetical protein